MGGERIFHGTPLQAAGGRVIASPFQFLVTGEDNLRIRSACSHEGIRLALDYRFVTLDGRVAVARLDHVPNSDRTIRTTDHKLDTGYLLNVVVRATAGSALIGQCYVIVELIRGLTGATALMGQILGGYVTAQQGLAWPGSAIQSSIDEGGCQRAITGTTPAAGAEISEDVPTGARWEIIAWTAALTVDATVATRRPLLLFQASGVTVAEALFDTTLTAGQSNSLWAGQGYTNIFVATVAHAQAPTPIGHVLLAGHTFRTSTQNLQAGDQWTSPKFLVREWLEVA